MVFFSLFFFLEGYYGPISVVPYLLAEKIGILLKYMLHRRTLDTI